MLDVDESRIKTNGVGSFNDAMVARSRFIYRHMAMKVIKISLNQNAKTKASVGIAEIKIIWEEIIN